MKLPPSGITSSASNPPTVRLFFIEASPSGITIPAASGINSASNPLDKYPKIQTDLLKIYAFSDVLYFHFFL
jgi:hypothetical protein